MSARSGSPVQKFPAALGCLVPGMSFQDWIRLEVAAAFAGLQVA